MAREKIPLVFYRTKGGTEPVREWIRSLPEEERRLIGEDLARVQWRWPVGMPLCRSLGNGLWEVRTTMPGNRSARIIFCQSGGKLVALHGFIKKSQKTPRSDVDLALDRMQEAGLND